jgi:predicted peptidase
MENEDVPGVGLSSRLPHWWSYKESSFVLKSLEYVKRNYPVDTNRVVLLGYSMGGYGTWNIGLRYTDRFA